MNDMRIAMAVTSVCAYVGRYVILKEPDIKWVARDKISYVETLIKDEENKISYQINELNKHKARLLLAKQCVIRGEGYA
jgi:hypothetical protein